MTTTGWSTVENYGHCFTLLYLGGKVGKPPVSKLLNLGSLDGRFTVSLGVQQMNFPSDMADLVSTRASHWIGGRALVLAAHPRRHTQGKLT
jgi:hypothetical protein